MEQVAHRLSTNLFSQLKGINTEDMRKRFPRWERKKRVDLTALPMEIRHLKAFVPFSTTMTTQAQCYLRITNVRPHISDTSSSTGSVCLSVRERVEVSPWGGDKGKVARSFLLLLLHIVFLFLNQTLPCEPAHTWAQRVFTPSPTEWSSQQRVFQCDQSQTLITIALLVSLNLHSLHYFVANHWVLLT